MKVRILRDTIADGRQVLAGEVLDLPGEDARTLMAMRKATPVEANAPIPSAAPIQTADPGIVHRDPASAHRTPRKQK